MMSADGLIMSEVISCGSAPGSPKTRIKFLCSYGGKILPRPADAHLKYVGGETRVISVPKDIHLQDLMKRLTNLMDGEMTLKYQLVPEELDALVSVKSDEDVRHMFEEGDRCESAGAPRLRAFLFPAKPVVVDNGSIEPPLMLTQRYIDAINGIVRASTIRHLGSLGVSSISACSSPRSPESFMTDGFMNAAETFLPNTFQNGKTRMHKVHSSPNLSILDSHQGSPNSQSSFHHHYLNHRQQLNHSNQFSKPPLDPHRGSVPERLPSIRSVGQVDGVKYQVDSVPPQYHYQPPRHHRGGGGGYTTYMHQDEYGRLIDGRRAERPRSPMSPAMLSPRHGYIGTRVWDGPMAGTTDFTYCTSHSGKGMVTHRTEKIRDY